MYEILRKRTELQKEVKKTNFARNEELKTNFNRLQVAQRPHKLRKILAISQTSNGIHGMETGDLPFRERPQNHFGAAPRSRFERKRFSSCQFRV